MRRPICGRERPIIASVKAAVTTRKRRQENANGCRLRFRHMSRASAAAARKPQRAAGFSSERCTFHSYRNPARGDHVIFDATNAPESGLEQEIREAEKRRRAESEVEKQLVGSLHRLKANTRLFEPIDLRKHLLKS